MKRKSIRCRLGFHRFSTVFVYPPRSWMTKPSFSFVVHCERCSKSKFHESLNVQTVFVDGLGFAPNEEELNALIKTAKEGE